MGHVHGQRGPNAGCNSADRAPGGAGRQQQSRSGKHDARCGGIASKQGGDIADSLHPHGPGLGADRRQNGLTAVSILGADADFQQLVMGECLLDFAQHRRRDAVDADENHRFTVMGQRLELALLRICECEEFGHQRLQYRMQIRERAMGGDSRFTQCNLMQCNR